MAEYRDPTPIDPNRDYQITQLARFIREKMYGIDTREAIALALERVYDDASKSGNANMEVARARGEYSTLDGRLSADYNYIYTLIISMQQGGPKELFFSINALNAALPNGADFTVLVFDSSLMDGAHSFFWDGSIWVDLGIYQGIEIADGSITTEKFHPDFRVKLIKLVNAMTTEDEPWEV